MQSQPSQRVRRMASPSTSNVLKQGPMKATCTFGLKSSPTTPRSSNSRKNSPSSSCSSPTSQWAAESLRKTPDRGSPSSPSLKEKTKAIRQSPAPAIKRTGSYDTIAAPYLKGEWPRGDIIIPLCLAPQQPDVHKSDKATQTSEDWEELVGDKKKKGHKRSASLGNGDTLKEVIKARLAKNSKEGSRTCSSGNARTSPVQGNHQAISLPLQSKAVAIPHIPTPKSSLRIRGSVEGLNQEIEKIVLTNTSGNEEFHRTQEPTPEGHRAPVCVQLLRSVDTQTPSRYSEERQFQEEVAESPASQPESESPLFGIPDQLDSPHQPSPSESPEVKDDKELDSPNPENFLFRREPPDGCEKVKMIVEEPKHVHPLIEFTCPIYKPEKCHIPSKDGSAFFRLQRNYRPSEMTALKTSAAAQNASSNIVSSLDSQ